MTTPKDLFELARTVAPIAKGVNSFTSGAATWEDALKLIITEMDWVIQELMQKCEQMDALKTPGANAPEVSAYAEWTAMPKFKGTEDQLIKERMLANAVGRSLSMYTQVVDAFVKSYGQLPPILKFSVELQPPYNDVESTHKMQP